jgi:hypothetical protein
MSLDINCSKAAESGSDYKSHPITMAIYFSAKAFFSFGVSDLTFILRPFFLFSSSYM